MSRITVNPRPDPYKNFKFRIKWDGRYVAGVSKVSALKRTTEVVEHREGTGPGSTRRSPGRTKYEPITLERGVTHDLAFEEWANGVAHAGVAPAGAPPPGEFRKDLVIELVNEKGQLFMAYKVFRAWVSEYQALPDLDASANAVAIERLTLEHDGWERDATISEPKPQSRGATRRGRTSPVSNQRR